MVNASAGSVVSDATFNSAGDLTASDRLAISFIGSEPTNGGGRVADAWTGLFDILVSSNE